ncbi:MAG: hypothetical protein J5809_00740 [Selenomonadaceae bacterium]|nr:hypothetical protein [Selenomonadaceae bacterium]
MARQLKKILKKVQPKPKTPEKPPEKVGKDYLLIVILSLTVIFMIIGWENFTGYNRALYIALIISLGTTYARRHFNLTPTQDLWTERASFLAMVSAIALFFAVLYQQFWA